MFGSLEVQGPSEHRISLARGQLDHQLHQLFEAVLLDGQDFELRHRIGVRGHLAQRTHMRVERTPGVVQGARRNLADLGEET